MKEFDKISRSSLQGSLRFHTETLKGLAEVKKRTSSSDLSSFKNSTKSAAQVKLDMSENVCEVWINLRNARMIGVSMHEESESAL